MLEQKYYKEFIISDPFKDVTFAYARAAKDVIRKHLQKSREKKTSTLSEQEIDQNYEVWEETTPDGLQVFSYCVLQSNVDK